MLADGLAFLGELEIPAMGIFNYLVLNLEF